MNNQAPQPGPMPLLSERPMSRVQIIVVGLCVLLNLVDGFDVLAMAFTAPAVAKSWSVPPDQLGLLFSAGLAGMALGALFLSPLADIIGRRNSILICLVIVSAGMIAAAFSDSFAHLALARLGTGIGIGAMISSTSALVIEYASARRRGLAMGLMAVGFPAGAVLGGNVAIFFIDRFGWHSIFLVGGIATAALLPVVAWLMPESLSLVLQSRRPDALARANRILRRLDMSELDALPVNTSTETPAGKVALLFRAPFRSRVAHLSGLFLLVMLSFYFIINWAPKLAVALGQSLEGGLSTGLLMNLGGVAGGLLTGALIARVGLTRTSQIVIGLMALGIAGFGLVAGQSALITIYAVALGFSMFGVMACIYTLMTTAFPAPVRATAIGLVSTAGRVGSVLGPLIGGWLLAGKVTPALVCLLLAAPALLAVLLVKGCHGSLDAAE